MRGEKCETCRFWQGNIGGESWQGVCRRYAPRPDVSPSNIETDNQVYPVWPLTLAEEWCGEYQPAPVPPGSAE